VYALDVELYIWALTHRNSESYVKYEHRNRSIDMTQCYAHLVAANLKKATDGVAEMIDMTG